MYRSSVIEVFYPSLQHAGSKDPFKVAIQQVMLINSPLCWYPSVVASMIATLIIAVNIAILVFLIALIF